MTDTPSYRRRRRGESLLRVREGRRLGQPDETSNRQESDSAASHDGKRYVPRDPYGPLPPGTERVDYYEPSYVRGPQR